MRYDIIIVGGGPAGSSTAYNLSHKNLKILLIDKDYFPREKLCAGAVSFRAHKYLPEGWEEFSMLNEIYGGNLGWWPARGKEYIHALCEEKVVSIVDRKKFDFFLLENVKKQGIEVHEGEKFLRYSLKGENLIVETDKGIYETKILIGSDGALSKVRQNMESNLKPTAVLEAILEVPEVPKKGKEIFIDMGIVKWGYAWIFPKGKKYLSVGLASLKKEKKNLRELLTEYISQHPLLKKALLKKLKGWFIPISKGKILKGKGNIFLVGDAGFFSDAVLGEGIYYALWGGKILASCIEKFFPNVEKIRKCYAVGLKPLEKELKYAYYTGFISYNFQRLLFKNAEEEDLKKFFRFLRGELGFQQLFFYGFKKFLRALFRL
jgi:geranylgeranyl reductase family protein